MIGYNIRNIFIEKSFTKCSGEASPNTFYKKLKLSISLDHQSEMLWSLLLWYVQVEVYQNILKLRCWRFNLHLPYIKTLVSLSHFLYDFWRKIFLTFYPINCLNFIAWLSLLLKILGNMCIVSFCFPVCDVKKFESEFNFLIKSFSYKVKKSVQKCKYLTNEKSF